MIKTIAIIVVMVAANLVMVISIRRAAVKVEYSLRRYFMQKVGTEDLNVSAAVRAVMAEDAHEDKSVKVRTVYPTSENLSTAQYKSKTFNSDYRAVKIFNYFTPENAVGMVKQRMAKDAAPAAQRDYAALCSCLSFDTVYSLNTLSPEDQEKLLRSCLGEKLSAVIDDFKAETDKPFDSIAFYSYAKDMEGLYGQGFIVRTGNPDDKGRRLADGTSVVFDESICEGSEVIYGNTLYDYSI